jgi:hypothetical protein
MTRDDIVSMVQEVIITNSNRNPLDFRLTTLEQIEHFAALVAERDTALLRQALEAVEERYVGALRDKAITALRERLEGKE